MNSSTVLMMLMSLIVILIVKGIKVVPIGYEWVIEDLRKPRKKTLKAGVHFIFPIISRVRNKVSIKENTMRLPPQPVVTAEEVQICVEMVVFYRIVNPIKAVYNTENFEQDLVCKVLKSALDIAREMSVDEILKARNDFAKEIQIKIEDVNELFGCIINRIEIVNVKLPKDLEELYKKKAEEQRIVRNNTLYQNESNLNLENTKNNKTWCDKLRNAWEAKNVDEIIGLFDNKVKYYKDTMTRLYSLNEIKEEWTEILNEDYKRIDINIEIETERTFMINIKAEERIIHNILAKVELNSEGKCIYFKKWEENL